MTFHFGWPQIIWLCLTLITLSYHAALDGQTKRIERYNFVTSLVSAVLGGAFLYWGGFFG